MANTPGAKKKGSRKIAGMKVRGKKTVSRKSGTRKSAGKKKSGIGVNHRGGSARRDARIPTREQVLEFITDNPDLANKREIARAFGLKGQDKIPLKVILKELEEEGLVDRSRKTLHVSGELPPVGVIEVTGRNKDGEITARPSNWRGAGDPPQIYVTFRKGETAKPGERILAKMEKQEDGTYTASVMRRLQDSQDQILGVYQKVGHDGRVQPIKRGSRVEYSIRSDEADGAKSGDLVMIEVGNRRGREARIIENLGSVSDPRTVSLISIHDHEIPFEFPENVVVEAEQAEAPDIKTRRDLTDLPFVTIDPADARDHDDAVFAEADTNASNEGGHIVWVAIADVAHFIRPGSALDREALKRGNSCYFPDRVVPMLPDILSGDLCSLHEGVVRSCMVVRMVFNAAGKKISHEFLRGAIRSAASLNYSEVEQAHLGNINDKTGPLLDTVITPLYNAYHAVARARDKRGPLALDLPEHRVEINDEGVVTSVAFRERIEAHRVIEDFMIQANVSAAETLGKRDAPLLYRIHEPPGMEKAEALQEFLKSINLSVPKGGALQPSHFNKLLAEVDDGPYETMVNEMVLRSQSRAEYSIDNQRHFGLNLDHYAHFTSPIRRYADLIIHRALVTAGKLGDDGLSDHDIKTMEETAQTISEHERRAMAAERDATDRYVAAYMADHIGAEFTGRVSGVAKFGLFVKLNETGADGLIPIRTLGTNEYFEFDEKRLKLIGERSGTVYHLGQAVTIRLAEATPVTGGLIFEMIEGGEKAKPGDRKPRRPSQSQRRRPTHKQR